MSDIKTKVIKNNEKPIQKYRFIIQILFVLLCIWIGVEFYLFVRYLESGGNTAFYSRPPGVDGFLPISSFMSFYLFLMTGEIHWAHPAGVFIFIAIILMSFVIGKSFCSWLCPVGFISEMLADFGQKIFRKKIKMPKFLDYPLRGIKYLALGFLFYSVFVLMNDIAIKAFLDGSYNIVADIKMWYFFANASRVSLIVIVLLVLLSVVSRGFWCRYLCPYGALLGIISLLSPFKIKRNKESCTDCGLCAKVCPSFIKVDELRVVNSDECTSCIMCVDVCPVKDTLLIQPAFSKSKRIKKKLVILAVTGIFIFVTGYGIVTGIWQNKVTKEEYLTIQPKINEMEHPSY
jgi:polyferredoxin